MSSSSTASRLSSLVQNATSDPQHVPGLVVQVVDRLGHTKYSNASGIRGLGVEEPMTTDAVFWIASCTKLISAIALMQLVEQRKADLDSADLLEEVVPELKDIQILEHGKLRPKANRITLRMLMTHTAGFSYSFYTNEDLWTHHFGKDATKDEFQGKIEGVQQPLIYEPGTSHQYSVGIDWVGIFIERRSGTSLEEFTKTNIFQPLGMASTSFVPSQETRSKMAIFHQRGKDLAARAHFYGPARAEMEDAFQSAGAGLLSTAADYTRVLSMILNNGVSPHTQQRVLLRETIDQMFQNQIPDYMAKHVEFANEVSRPDLMVPPASKTVPVEGYFGWGLNFQLQANPKATNAASCEKDGFPRGAAAGLSNCFWALDREKGVAAVCMTQILPFGDPYVLSLWEAVQEVIFED